jgi:hypothetical protein
VQVVASVTQENLGAAKQECLDQSAAGNTDAHPGHRHPLKAWKEHHAINRSRGDYHRQNADGCIASINTAESFPSGPKLGVGGAWHPVAREPRPKYANEFAFRWSHRNMTRGERMQRFVPRIAHKRIPYRPRSPRNRDSPGPWLASHFRRL